MKDKYNEALHTIERLQRLHLEVVKKELESMNIRNINNVQALILYYIGDDQMAVGELTQRGYYLGSNASYNLRKMIESGYIEQFPSPHDKRSFYIQLSEQGRNLYQALDQTFKQYAKVFGASVLQEEELNDLQQHLTKWESFFRESLIAPRIPH